jgi:sec-independent protein translocase protein TatC
MAKLGDTVKGARVLSARVRAAEAADPEGRMSLIEHIRELRNRVVKICLALIVGTGVGLAFFTPVWHLIERPFCSAEIKGRTGCHGLGHQLVLNSVLAPFTLRVEVAFFFGLVVTSPIWLYQIWAFVAPGLYKREKRWTFAFVGTAAPLFVVGAGIAYFAMSRGLAYLLGLTPNGVLNLPPVSTYLGYFFGMIIGFGLAFELPLLVLMLNMAGVLTHEFFRKWRRLIIFGVFVFAGIASPSPDPLTMLLLAGPCVLLVEVAELLIWMNDRRRAARASLYEGLADDELAPLDDTDPIDSDPIDSDRR